MKNITALTSSMNRSEDLENTIEKCLKINNLKSHIIIDYSSKTPVEKSLSIDHPNLKIYRIDNQEAWSISRAYNAGFSLIETDYILKIDADVEINYEMINKLNYENYDLIIFSPNENDVGNWLIKKEHINNVNGMNEFITSVYDDHDLIKRVRGLNSKMKELILSDAIIKTEHSSEQRVSSVDSYMLKKTENYFYAIRKALNDYGGYISSKNFWSKNNIRNYEIIGNKIKINHCFTYRDTGLVAYIVCKFIFLKTFFKIYFRHEKNIFFSVLKRALPLILLPASINLLKNLFGFNIFPMSIQLKSK